MRPTLAEEELLAWLLDALHEDLNRVARKQYTELKDSGGRPDEIVAEEAWQQHLTRDHSIITDLFYGQLKSKVTCQTCGHESVRFDPFNLLSLPLPMESYTLCEILGIFGSHSPDPVKSFLFAVVRLNGECPVKYGVRLNSEARYIELKEQLQNLSGITPDRLLLAEVAYCQIRKLLSDEMRVDPGTATELYAYELPDASEGRVQNEEVENEGEAEMVVPESPLARSPEVSHGSALCMPNILCFKAGAEDEQSDALQEIQHLHTLQLLDDLRIVRRQPKVAFLSRSGAQEMRQARDILPVPAKEQTEPVRPPAAARLQQEQHLPEPVPGRLGSGDQIAQSPAAGDQTNHATDCDDSLGYAFPFTLKAVLQGGQICALCHWTQFCRGCTLPCSDDYLIDQCRGTHGTMCIAIDWDPTALHLRYQSSREKLWLEHESVTTCRKLHTEPIDLDYCLRAFTSEERLETKYHCSNCQDKQPATKKLQIWRLPPILIIHLKRFDYVNSKWVKTQKVVNFPFKDFDPTAYLASVPQETILRHKQLQEKYAPTNWKSPPIANRRRSPRKQKPVRCPTVTRLESTSLLKTPIVDEHLKDYHQHQLLPGQDPFDLRYQLYAVVSHSGLLNGGHYISYACNPNGHWYCYNDSSCREVITDPDGNKTRRLIRWTAPYRRWISADRRETIRRGAAEKLLKDSPYGSRRSLNSYKCPSGDVKTPKIDTSAAYILFYERSGLDYKPYLPKVIPNGIGKQVPIEDLDENESELRKQLCSIHFFISGYVVDVSAMTLKFL
ncbi:hypothetical protein NQ317_005052 [Molorchus minor]|uniref:ubiquitinyl hydrolase 1 n=1 Tax=Molorchus minor TaxID=1323400 RepID=A0ABQ9JW75_9CUCU|nr:hypothetical protein NQ317_005052 [Molorchus minor]